ncbi:MAG TPA: lactate utilization protein B [Fimbriimonadaceae bacterium]|nr:lactate utilization protein B [Fimbriimonadaceae bacterium]
MSVPKVEAFARALRGEVVTSVRTASAAKVASRVSTLGEAFDDIESARTEAARIKDEVLDRLRDLLLEFEARATARRIQVHWASDAAEANRVVLEICRRVAEPGAIVAKAKSMATEEIGLNSALEGAGFRPIETDLGEYVVQIDGDHPSHIVTPIIHKNRVDVARSFVREGLGPYTEDPAELTMQARAKLRDVFRQASVGVSGANFLIAETGRIVLVENEGNNRFSTTAPRVHIAVAGIEKLLPSERELPLFLKLLAGSATGQRLTTYVHLISGPREANDPDGPEEVHVIFLDNGRTRVLEGRYREILRCIRCGACLNVCPVYRQVSGHAYRHVYSGPIGAVLAPALEGIDAIGDLAKASTLCGACEEVCPVKIPIPRMLLELRDEAARAGLGKRDIPWKRFATLAGSELLWRAGLTLLPIARKLPSALGREWAQKREMPMREGRSFREWWRERS